jgi:CO dehydrogenase maturation factor
MKIAVSGKGGVGKTLFAALLTRFFAGDGRDVIAIDADPDSNLAATLGLPGSEALTPISDMSELIAERTGVTPGGSSNYFKLNPRVDDIPERFSLKRGNIRLMLMGRIKPGGGGCYCPENALLKTLTAHLLLGREEVVILDMAAGIEHLGRATAGAVDKLIIVVEPGRRSLETAITIRKLAGDIGLVNIAVVGNKIRQTSDEEFIATNLPGFPIIGFLPYDPAITAADLSGQPVVEASPRVLAAAHKIYLTLIGPGG